MSEGRRVLVTGGAGFIGGSLAARLVAGGDEVIVLDDLSTGRRERVPAGARLEIADVRDESAVRKSLIGVDVVFHLAARVTVRGSVARFRDDHDVNVGGTIALLESLRDSSVRRLVFASSMAVYADAARGVRVTEGHPTCPASPYGVSKLAGEHYCRVVAGERGIEHVSLRYFNTWGPGQVVSPYVGVATIFANAFLDGEQPTIFGDGEQTRDFVHVDDVVRATVAAADVELEHDVLNVGTGRETTVSELFTAIRDAVGSSLEPSHAASRAEELRHSVADPSRAETTLGVRMDVSFDPAPLVADLRARRRDLR